jgi:DNA-binding response OmpR family regulator
MPKILVVEDQPEIRKLIRIVLGTAGHELFEAVDAESGMAQALAVRPDLVLLDIMMPGSMDGLQLCEWLKGNASTQHAKVVLVSARGHRNDLSIGRSAGADDYLLKPFLPTRLLEVVRGLMVEA